MGQVRKVPMGEAVVTTAAPDVVRSAGSHHETDELLTDLERDVRACEQAGIWSEREAHLIPKWQALVRQEPRRFIRADGTIDGAALAQFRRLQIFVPDVPMWDPSQLSLRTLLGGGRRGDQRMMRECLALVRCAPYEPLLRKYPCSMVGHPHVFRWDGYVFTYRWLKHIWSLGLLREVIGGRLPTDVIAMDIGSSYGIFSSLIKREWPGSHHVLVDFPEQLLLARYFLAESFPDCRIAGIKEVLAQPHLTRAWLSEYDFTLVPCQHYQALTAGSVDLVSNFASFGEMSRQWFTSYINSAPLASARWLFLVNRLQSAPTYETDLTILDYPLWGSFRPLHFALSPIFSKPYIYPRRWAFLTGKEANQPYFEYLGEQHVV